MARKTESDHGTSAKSLAHLKSLRNQIDKLDLQILKLVNERADLAAEIGRIKNDQGAEVFSPAREEEVLKNVLEANKGPLDEATIRGVFREIISGSRALQKIIKVAYLGPEYSYSHLAAVERFGQRGRVHARRQHRRRCSRKSTAATSISASCRWRTRPTAASPTRWTCSCACRSSRSARKFGCGSTTTCWPTASRSRFAGSTRKPQALSQCRNWLSKNLPHADLKDVSSTAVAAQLAQQEPGAAAVASRQAAVQLRPAHPLRRHRGLSAQRDALRRHRPSGSAEDRRRQDRPHVQGAAQSRLAGRRAGRLQAATSST